MNRSFKAQEPQIQAAVERQRQEFRASMMAEKEDELALFLEMRRREKEQDNLLHNNPEEFGAPLGSKPGTSLVFSISAAMPARKTGTDDFLNSEGDKNDYDWLLTPPGTPLFPSLEMESQKTVMSQLGDPTARPTALNSRLANSSSEPAARSNLASKQLTLSPGLSSSSGGTRRPSSSGGPGSRPATPTGRSTLTTNSKASRSSTPIARATLPSSTRASTPTTRSTAATARPTFTATKPTGSAAKLTSSGAKPMASGTKPTGTVTKSLATVTKPTGPMRSTTPLLRPTARSSTPTSRPTVPPPKTISRSVTPTRRPATTPSASSTKAAPSQVKLSASVAKPTPKSTPSKNHVPSRGTSPTVRSRPWKPSDMPGFSLETPPNLRTTLPERPLSATRGRPGASSSRSTSVEPGPTGRPRRQSCSPSRGRTPNGVTMHASGSSVPAFSRIFAKANDNVSPVVIGTQMVERVINMRKLAPPKSDDKNSPRSNLSAKSSSPDSSGFGRSLSKKSLDMAMRHMDIRRSIPNSLRPLMTNIPASSMYSVRSGPQRSRAVSISDSPLATSSNASSEISVNNNGVCLDAIEREDDAGSERGCQSPASVQAR